MIIKIGIRVLVLCVIVTGLNFVYNLTFYSKDLAEKSDKIIELRNSKEETDIYYFAESSNFNYRENDSIKNSISEITNFFFPQLKITPINNAASHAGIFKYWLKEIEDPGKRLKALVVTLNLRSFDAAWRHSKLETPLIESTVLVRPYPNLVNRFLLSLQAFDNKTEKQREQLMLNEWKEIPLRFPFPFKYKTVKDWDFAMANGGHLKADGSWDDAKSVLACHYIKGYAFNLDENNQRIKDFDEIVAWCEKHQLKLYLNLLAENTQYADSLVGKELVFLMKQNRDFLVERYNKGNCVVVDNLELVPGIEYTDQDWTTEHYGYKGRMIIAKNLASKLKQQFTTHYKAAY